ncbi:heparanase-like protein 1 [Andrographis paniculata]|uniref:heparanase-like protein 1 n=1 Tax=Andrographis paniculata TaxID=175694 RepID=UPI0021E97B63|nr:heparanase-like protein 1 [Andrographis paniculata]
MGYWIILLFLSFIPAAIPAEDARIVVDTSSAVAETDDNYICATIDWWPQDKCNYDRCPWGSSSVLNLDLSHSFLHNAIQAFGALRIRVGGSLQDQVIYNVGNLTSTCEPFKKENGGLFGFSKGCLRMERWDQLNKLFEDTGVIPTFGLNALYGRRRSQNKVWEGEWDPSNARDFIKYTISKGYRIDSWEFGNELSGRGVGASVNAEQYGKDAIRLNNMINELYASFPARPRLIAPGGFYDKWWFNTLLQVSGPHTVNIMSHHMYTLGPGNDHNLLSKILNPDHLNKATSIFSNVTSTIQSNGPWASAWVGESGGVFNNGARGISDAFINSFWYLDQLGMAARFKTKVYCRQTLIGGFYGLLNKTTFVPNPDYYSALLWHRLMGKGVLELNSYASPHLRAYAHCAKERTGITVLLINLSNETTYNVEIMSSNNQELTVKDKTNKKQRARSFINSLKRSVSWIGNKASDEKLWREEYHLTPESGDLQSKTMLLNGEQLQLTQTGNIPSLAPVLRDVKSPISIAPLSIKFAVYPNFEAQGCE